MFVDVMRFSSARLIASTCVFKSSTAGLATESSAATCGRAGLFLGLKVPGTGLCLRLR